MKRFKNNKKSKNTIKIILFIVFFCVIFLTFILFNNYSQKTTEKVVLLVDNKIGKVLYQFFTDLITDDVIKNSNTDNLLVVTKNKNDEIITVDYNLEETYKILTNVSYILKKGILDFENGQIDVLIYDNYIENSKNGIILKVPFFLKSNNVFINNLGPKIPVIVNFNNSLLTNIKTKVTNYGLNNALLELYITVEIKKLIITPVIEKEKVFNYDILVGAKVVAGSVPNFYSGQIESSSNILNLPIE